MNNERSLRRRRRACVLPAAALLASALAIAGTGGAAAQTASDESGSGESGSGQTFGIPYPSPSVDAISFTSTPSLRSSDWSTHGDIWVRPPAEGGVFDTYASGDVIEITFRFNEAVTVTGELHTKLSVGDEVRRPRYVSGSGTDSLVFQYTVADDDVDLDGVLLQEGTYMEPGISGSGSVRSASSDQDALFVFSEFHDPNHKVGPVPYVTDIRVVGFDEEYVDLVHLTEPEDPQVIRANGGVLLDVTYNTPVKVSGDPTFRLHFGDNDAEDLEAGSRDARFRYRGYYEKNVLVFHYLMEGGLSDTDGISIMNGHLGGEITAISGGRQAESLSFPEYQALTEFEADPTPPPRAVGFEIVSEPTHFSDGSDVADTYGVGDVIKIEVTFDQMIRTERGFLPGPAAVLIKIGDTTRAAINDFDECCEDSPDTGHVADGNGNTEVFAYQVQAGDLDADGISIEAVVEDNLYERDRSLYLNLRRVGFNTHILGTDSDLRAEAIHDGMTHQPGHRVDGGEQVGGL